MLKLRTPRLRIFTGTMQFIQGFKDDVWSLLSPELALVRETEAFAQTAVLVQYNTKGSNRRSLAATSTEYLLLRAKLHTCTPDQPLASAMYHVSAHSQSLLLKHTSCW